MMDWDFYQASGFSFLPVRWRGKNPAINAWEHLQTRRPSAEEVAEWRRRRRSNVGIVTGAVSGIFVLDIDSDEAQATVDALGIPPTLTVKTRNGRHYFFKHPGFPVSNKVKILDNKIDVRGDGGYVVGPGSTHEDDHSFEYEWEDNSPIHEAPQWLLDEIKPKPPAPRPKPKPKANGHDALGVHPYAQAVLANALMANSRTGSAAGAWPRPACFAFIRSKL